MIDEKTLEALTMHLSVQLAVTPTFRLRELAKANPGDRIRQQIAADLARSLAAPFDIKRNEERRIAPDTGPHMRKK